MTSATRLIRVAAIGAAGAAAAAVAASGASAAPEKTDPCKPPAKYRGDKADTYNEYCGVCQDTGWKQIRADYQIASKVPATIAYRYAAFDHKGSILPPAVDGCRKGFALRGKP